MEQNGVTLSDCEKVSDLIGALLDSSDFLRNSYLLEVSSPGINRSLKKESHFQQNIGKKVKISLYTPLSDESKQKNFSGILLGCKDQIIEVEDVVSGKTQIQLSSIHKAHLNLI